MQPVCCNHIKICVDGFYQKDKQVFFPENFLALKLPAIGGYAEMEKRADTADISVLFFHWLC